jgi:hypothetical protein
MFPVRPQPIGVNAPLLTDRQPVQRVYAGDAITLRVRVMLPYEPGTPATPDNSILLFVLSNQRFAGVADRIWEGRWHEGISEVDHPGLLEIKIPQAISADLRRGSLIYSLVVTNRLGEYRTTLMEGTLLVEYAPTSPIHDVPYRDDDDDADTEE